MNPFDIQVYDIAGKFVSCIVSVFITFQYFDTRFTRVYNTKVCYIFWKILSIILNFALYFFNSPIINICFWLVMIFLTGKIFYYDEHLSKGKYYISNCVFVLAVSVCESTGVILVNIGAHFMKEKPDAAVFSFVQTMTGSLFCILLYYLVLKRFFIRKRTERITVIQYTVYAVVTIYALVNIGEILFLFTLEMNRMMYLFLMTNAITGVFLNLYLFYFLDMFAENRELKYKVALYEKQASFNYNYYARQIESYKTAMGVIHDIRKHMRVLEELKQGGIVSEIQSYTDSFEDMLSPLLVNQYCNNMILNIIIHDKLEDCNKNAIVFDIRVHDVNLDFMEPIDITTIFGNLLDNAVEASRKAEQRNIILKIYPFNGFIYVQISNTFSGQIKFDAKGKPVSDKGEEHGIGLENVEKTLLKYSGNIEFTVAENLFMAEMMFSQLR